MLNTNRKKRRTVVLLVIAMLLAMTLSAPATFGAEATESFTFPPGVTKISIDLVVTEDQAYGGLEFGVTCSNGLTFDGFEVNKDLLLYSDVSGEKNGVYYYGYFASDNIYKGTLKIGTLHFLYEKDGKETVTIKELTLSRYEDNQKISQESKGAMVYEVSRKQAHLLTTHRQFVLGKKRRLLQPPFTDIVGHWAEQDILSAVEKGS